MNILRHAESIEISEGNLSAAVVAEGLRSWNDGPRVLLSSGPRLFAEAPGRLRVVPDRLAVVDDAAETHAVVLARFCPAEEMELSQKWTFDQNGTLSAELEFILPPAWGPLPALGVRLELSEDPLPFVPSSPDGRIVRENGLLSFLLPLAPVPPGIRRMHLFFAPR